MTDRELLEMAAKAAGMVSYNPETGLMTWRQKTNEMKDAIRWNARYADSVCGTIDDKGYRRILCRFEAGRVFRVRTHRLAWLITYGKLPDGEIDHINQDKADNRISNLRDVPKEINQRNGTRKSNNTSGVPGRTWVHRKPWESFMNDVELTRFSAKAFGDVPIGFSPLTDDGDALRLAVSLKFGVTVDDQDISVTSQYGKVVYQQSWPDPYAATRRAIVLAAASIGKAMT